MVKSGEGPDAATQSCLAMLLGGHKAVEARLKNGEMELRRRHAACRAECSPGLCADMQPSLASQ